jgi:hypothetical protein
MVRTEGVAGLYRGLVPTLLGVGPTRAIFFGGYSFLKQLLDADGGGTIDVTELEGPLLSTGMVTNHRELEALMERIATGGGEITFWEFLEAFKPPKPGVKLKEGEPDMKRLRCLLATAEHETLPEAFARDNAEDGLSDAEGGVIDLYVARAEGHVRTRQRAAGVHSESESGDSGARAMVIGLLLGAVHGDAAVPPRWAAAHVAHAHSPRMPTS